MARLFKRIKTPHIYAFLRTVYSCGLRLSEALHIRPGDIDRAAGSLHIRQGKGAKDRRVILPPLTLDMLGRYWKQHRNPNWIFPALGRDGKGGSTATKPMSINAAQGGLRRYLKRARITKSRVTIHTLNFHPHIHFVVPGGGIDTEKGLWRGTRKDFYAPGQALAKVFKGVFRELTADKGLYDRIDPAAWRKNWVVDCEAVGRNREGVLKYLAPYVFKTAITDNRIAAVGKGKVTFTYVKSGSARPRRMTLPVMEFIRRYLMHVLPNGFMRIRHYGFMGSGCSIPHEKLVALVRMAHAFEVDAVEHVPAEKQPFLCPRCGGRLVAKRILTTDGKLVATFNGSRPQRE